VELLLILAITCAALESLALWKGWRPLELAAKPAVMVFLFAWLSGVTGLKGAPAWFGIGVLFSLAGDVLLLWYDRFFVYGLAAFLFAHIAYILGFNTPLPEVSTWGLLLAVIVGLSAARLLRRILQAVRAKRQGRLTLPVALYGAVITLMLLAAWLTLSNTDWDAGASLLVSFGALAFFASDILLAWNKFVTPVANGRLFNIALYHAGQIALIAGVVRQFS